MVPGRLELPTSVQETAALSGPTNNARLRKLLGTGSVYPMREELANPETHPMIGNVQITLILLALATASTPALARGSHYRHHHHGWHGYGYHGYGYHGSYNYGGPHYSTGDYYNNSRQLDGTR